MRFPFMARRCAHSGVIAATLLLTACGGGSSSRTPVPPVVPPAAGAVNGAIAKGMIAGGDVAIREVLADGTLSEVLGTAVTDANGDYDAVVSADYQGGAVKVTVTATSGTTMKCDAPSGCADAAFGDEVALADGFSLSAFITALDGDTSSVHVTPITDMAARRAESDADGLDANAIADANDVVRQTFSLPGDITRIRPVDLTDSTAVARAGTASQQVSVLSAGILEAVQQTDDVVSGATSFEDATQAFAAGFATSGGLVLNDTTASEGSIVSLDDILAGSTSVVTQVQTEADAAGVDAGLDAVAASIELSEMELPDVASDDPDTTVEPIDTVTAGRLDQGKALISDLRDLTASSQLNDLETAADTFGDALELAFDSQVDLVTGVVTNDLGIVTEALAMSADAMSRAGSAALDDETLTTFVVAAGEMSPNSPEITVAIDGTLLTIAQDVDGVDVDLNGSFDITIIEQTDDVTDSVQADGAITIDGEAANDEFSVVVSQGSQATVSYTDVETMTTDGYMDMLTVPSVSLDLDVTATALLAADMPAFNGTIALDVVGLEFSEADTFEQNSDGTAANTFVETLTFSSFDLSLSGGFSDAAGSSVEATFSLAADNENDFVLQVEEIFSFDPVLGDTYTETTSEETADDFVSASATIGLIASLPGIDTSVQVTLSVERTGVEDGTVELSVQFAGKAITVSGNSIDEVVSITNQSGVVATMVEDAVTGLLGGSITVEDEEVATIEENEDGVVIIRYSDGTFETFA